MQSFGEREVLKCEHNFGAPITPFAGLLYCTNYRVVFKPKNDMNWYVDQTLMNQPNVKDFFTVQFGQIFSIEVPVERVVEVLTKDQRQLRFAFASAQEAKEVREMLRNTCFYDHLNPP